MTDRLARRKGAIAWMAKNPVAANLLMAMFLIGGLLMGLQVRQEVFPDFNLDYVQVSVTYPGASPEEVEKGVLLAIEDAVRDVTGVKAVSSTASEGTAAVYIELMLDAEPNVALSDLKNAIDRITSLPEQTERPVVSLLTSRFEVISLILHGDHDEMTLRRLAERTRDEMLADPDIFQVDIVGAKPREISIEVPSEQLRIHGLTLEQVSRRVAETSVDLPGGVIKTEGGEVLIRTHERRDDVVDFGGIIVKSTPEGGELRLRDIAELDDGFAEVDRGAFFYGKPAVMLRVYRTGNMTPIEVSEAASRHVERLRQTLPAGVKVDTWLDWSVLYRERVDLLTRNAAIGLLLVLAVLGLFLELRLAFWVTMGIPISFLGSLIFMPTLDVSVNMISLFAFIVTLGMVVDDAIIVGEAIYHARQRGIGRVQAAIEGVHEVAMPVCFSIATTMAAFSPMLMLPGFTGKLFRVIPIIVILVLALSLVESLFVLPAHLAHQKPGKDRGPLALISRGQQKVAGLLEWFIRRPYAAFLRGALRERHLVVAFGVAIFIVTIGAVAGGVVGFQFQAEAEGDIVTAEIELPYGSSVEDTRRLQAQLVGALHRVLDRNGGSELAKGVFTEFGARLPPMDFDPLAFEPDGSHIANAQVLLVEGGKRSISASQLAEQWQQEVGDMVGLDSIKFVWTFGPGPGKGVDVELAHPDLDLLEATAAELALELTEFDGVSSIDKGFVRGKQQLDLTLTPLALSQGLTSADVASQVRSAFYGSEAVRQQEGRNELRVYTRLPPSERRSIHDIEDLIIRTPSGGEMQLRDVADIHGSGSRPTIKRFNGSRVIHVTADIDPAVTTSLEMRGALERDVLPQLVERYPGLSFAFAGENRAQMEALEALGVGYLVAILVIYALLAIPFRSYLQPLIVMTAIPFGFVGAVIGHIVMGYKLTMVSAFGVVALSGVVVNDSLVLVHTANGHRREGMGLIDAVHSAACRRFRPIMLTSATTFLGLAPMILETSFQAVEIIPMAISLGFGVLFATGIILVLVPAVYLLVEDFRAFVGGGEPPSGETTTPEPTTPEHGRPAGGHADPPPRDEERPEPTAH
ncbi:MAG: efflux RND transporter permease subunit [Myxococcota bacterium]